MSERNLRVRLTDEEMAAVREYANEHGLQMPWAYAELIRAGLDSED
jgi:predicted DNA binding CopG/RHH family protein